MIFFARLFIIRLKMSMSPVFLFTLILFPLAVMTAGLLLHEPGAGKISVGFLYPASLADEMLRVTARFESSIRNNGEVVTYPAHERQAMENDVAKGRLECAYVIDGDELVLIKSPVTMSDQVLNVALVSVLVETMSGELGYNVLKPFFPATSKHKIVTDIQQRADAYASTGSFMDMETIWVGEDPAAVREVNFMQRVFHGITALFVLFLSLLGALTLAAECKSRFFLRIIASGTGLGTYLAANVLVLFTVNLGFFFLSGVFGALGGLPLYSLATELVMAISFSAAAAGLSLGLAVLIGDDAVFAPLLIFLFVTVALFGNVFFPLTEVIAYLNPLPYILLTGFYMAGLEKAIPLAEAVSLLICAIVSVVVCIIGSIKTGWN